MLGSEDTIAWLTPNTAVVREDHGIAMDHRELLEELWRFSFIADGKVILAFALSAEHLLEICDIVVRLMAVSVVQSVIMDNKMSSFEGTGTFVNAPTLEYLMEQCQSLKVLLLVELEMDENHCRVLGAYSRPDLEIVLRHCRFTTAGASALVEVLGRNQGPTKLYICYIDNVVLADGLRGNSRLKSLRPCFSRDFDIRDGEVLAIAGALKENKGLVDLDLPFHGFVVYDETWDAICDSFKTHLTLEVLDFRIYNFLGLVISRIHALVDMMKVNMSIHTIHLHDRYSEHELFRKSVIPYLGTNRFRQRLLDIQQTRPIPYRAKVLGRALLAVRTDPNRIWMLLSGNAEVAFPSSTMNITPAASLPTPATVGACSNAATAAANHVTTDHPASNVAALASGQKRKGRP
jgi:hypothetical protein